MARFLRLTGSLDLEFVNWSFMHDLPGSGFPNTVGLRYANGTAKAGWHRWKELKAVPYQ
jgi:hypothetical protein